MMRRQRVPLHRAVLLPLVFVLVLSVFASTAHASVPVELPGSRAAPSRTSPSQSAAPAAPAAPALSVTKTLVTPTGRSVFYTGETVSFDITVQNTGTTDIVFLPQFDQFGTECLEFLPKASPVESEYSNVAGSIDWYDLTFVNGQDLAPGSSFTTRVDFLVVGPRTGTGASGYNTVQIDNARDANNTPVPAASATVNFTCALRPAVTVEKSIVSPVGRTVFLTGETVRFDVVVTNSGPTTLAYIPQFDQFDTACLEFLPKASPAESEYSNVAGSIDWYDLTFVNGQDLPPGDGFTTHMDFLVVGPAAAPTLPGTNTATVNGALDEYGSPTLPAQDSVQYTCAAPASIGDYVWNDLNGNGLQDEGPGAGLNGVTLRLYQDDGDGIFEPGTDDVLLDTTVTAGDGGYLFDMLHAGDYWVDLDETTLPAGLTLTSGVDPLLVTVAYGEAYTTADFGYSGADLSITKTDSSDPVLAGANLTYTLVVKNNGPSSVPSVTVTDMLPAGVTFISASPTAASEPNPLLWNLGPLAPGESYTITVIVKVDAATRGLIYNEAGVSSPASDPKPENNAIEESTEVLRAALQLTKAADPTLVVAGGTVTYSYAVHNSGDVPLADVNVADDTCAPVQFTGDDGNGNSLLDPGETWTFACTTTVATDTTNTAIASGQPSDPNGLPLPGTAPVSDEATAFVDAINPRINIDKTASPATVHRGDRVLYTFVVTNPGDVALAGVTVSDDLCSPLSFAGGDTNDNGLLETTETWTYTCDATVIEDTSNTARVSGQPVDEGGAPFPGVDPVADDDTALVDVLNPGVAVAKSGPAASFKGDKVTFTYSVTNIGDAPLAISSVTDDICGGASYQSGDVDVDGLLGVAETWIYTCVYVIQSTDPDPLVNVVTVLANDMLGRQVSDTDDWQTDLVVARFGDFVWIDDGDGVQEPSETSGLNGVPVTVSGTDALGNTVNLIVHTVAGVYLVDNLLPGTYTASVPAAFNGYALSTSPSITFTLTTAAPERLDIDFGYAYPTAVQLADFVAVVDDSSVKLTWSVLFTDGSEAPRFHVWRSHPGGAWKRLTISPLDPLSTDGLQATYGYRDEYVEKGKRYLYELRSADGEAFGPWQVIVEAEPRKVFLPFLVR